MPPCQLLLQGLKHWEYGEKMRSKVEAGEAWQSCPASPCEELGQTVWYYVCFHKEEISKCSPSA